MQISTATMLFLFLSAASFTGVVSAFQSEWDGNIVERDGIVWVSNFGEPLWVHRASEPLRFELEQVFGVDAVPAEAILGIIADVAVDDDGNVFVLDRQESRITAFGSGGAALWTSGGRGGGPGELYRPTSIAWNGASSLFVANLSGSRLERFSMEGEYRNGHLLTELGIRGATIAGTLGPRTLVLRSVAVGHTGALISVVDWSGTTLNVVSQFTVLVGNSEAPEGATAVVPVRVENERVLVGEVDSYDVRFFHPDGRLARVVSRRVSPLVGFVDPRSPSSWLWPPLFLASGHFMTYSTWNQAGGGWGSAVDLFDPDGRYLYSRTWEGPEWLELGRPAAIDREGRLYTFRQDPFPQVRRYRITLLSLLY